MSDTNRIWRAGLSVATTSIGLAVGLVACGGSDDSGSTTTPTLATSFAVAKVPSCSPGDRPEAGLQGQIPIAERMAGFQGYNCNLKPLSATVLSSGEAVFEQFQLVHDKSGHVCGFAGPAFLDSPGTRVVDLTDPNNIVQTALLTTPGTVNPGEGLRVHEGRGLLVTANYNNPKTADDSTATTPHGFDVYDIGTDCRHPQLLATTTSIHFSKAGLVPNVARPTSTDLIYGHEGAVSADGLTYYVGDVPNAAYHAIDISDPTNPKYLATFQYPNVPPTGAQGATTQTGASHGVSVSDDGNRIYPVLLGGDTISAGGMIPQTGTYVDGFMVVDSSQIQARLPNPKMTMISSVIDRENSWAQSTIPVTIKGNKYLITYGERGTAQFSLAGLVGACSAGLRPFAHATMYDVNDESAPKLINRLQLEANDPKNCAAITPEFQAVGSFTYDVHMCTVDNRDDATTLACGYFQSGIRVYDIRDPENVKEIAYYNPPAKAAGAKSINWCAALPILDAKTGMVFSRCHDSGMVALKFESGVWPFPESTTPKDKQL